MTTPQSSRTPTAARGDAILHLTTESASMPNDRLSQDRPSPLNSPSKHDRARGVVLPLHGFCENHELLVALDDAMFAAIAGDGDALRRARELWAEARATLPLEVLDESREQYLKFAVEASRRVDPTTPRRPAAVLAALEVLEFLAGDLAFGDRRAAGGDDAAFGAAV